MLYFLTECWVEKDCIVDIPEFQCFLYPRMKCKSIQGGGNLVMIRKSFVEYVSIEKNVCMIQ